MPTVWRLFDIRIKSRPATPRRPAPIVPTQDLPAPVTHDSPDADPHSPIHADHEVLEAFRRAIQDGTWTDYHGPHVPKLEEALAQLHQVSFAYCCCSGTFAVELALRSVGIRPGDEVLLAAYDFPGNFRAIEAIGAHPVLVDIEPHSWSLDPEQVEQALRESRPKGVLVSHLHGSLADMESICSIARRHGLAVVEDASQATGATVQGRPAGSWGDAGTLSFGGSKLLTAGRGGALLTNQADVLQRAKIYCEQGNHAFPLSEIQAAILLPQVSQLAQRNQYRYQAATALAAELQNRRIPGQLAVSNDRGFPSYYKLGWLLPTQGPVSDRSLLLQSLAELSQGKDARHSWRIGEGFRGFTRKSERRCRKIGPLPHGRVASGQTILIHHTNLTRPITALVELAEFLNLGIQRAATKTF
jgi:perosamine synthetase